MRVRVKVKVKVRVVMIFIECKIAETRLKAMEAMKRMEKDGKG